MWGLLYTKSNVLVRKSVVPNVQKTQCLSFPPLQLLFEVDFKELFSLADIHYI